MEEDEKCPHCGSDNIRREGEKLVCMDCGSLIENNVVSSEQERFYSYEEAVEKGKHSFTPSPGPKTKTDRKNLRLAISFINDLLNKLHLPYFVKDDAIKYYKQLMQKKKIRKDKVRSISAALVYLVCRKSSIPLSFKRVASGSDIEKSELASSYMETIELLKVEVPPPSIESLAIYIAKKADLKPKTVALARKIANKLEKEIILGKDPNSIAAAAVYLAAKRKGEEVEKSKMAKIASVSDVTLRNQLIQIEKTLQE